MFALLRSGQRAEPAHDPRTAQNPTDLGGIQLFEALVSDTHAAALRTAAIASSVNALSAGLLLKSPQLLQAILPQQPTVLAELPRCQKELGLKLDTPPILKAFFDSFGHAGTCIAAFCEDADRSGIERAVFLHFTNLSTVWRRVSDLALKAVAALHPEILRCLPQRYGENTAVLRKLLEQVLRGERPCLDVNGVPFLPELPQRRPAARLEINRPCVVEHQGKTVRAIVRDISSSGVGLERAPDLVPLKVAVIEFDDGRCLAGVVVWSKAGKAGIKFDSPLGPTDPFLV